MHALNADVINNVMQYMRDGRIGESKNETIDVSNPSGATGDASLVQEQDRDRDAAPETSGAMTVSAANWICPICSSGAETRSISRTTLCGHIEQRIFGAEDERESRVPNVSRSRRTDRMTTTAAAATTTTTTFGTNY
jgi:hypothetical protein